jgi:phage shock protein E
MTRPLARLLLLAACDAAPDARLDAGPADAAPGADARPLGELAPAQLHDQLVAKDFLLIDVHTPCAGVIPQTDTRIPYNDVDALAAYIGTDLAQPVVLTCLSGAMSTVAGRDLIERGYTDVAELAGGMNAWEAAGYTLDPCP